MAAPKILIGCDPELFLQNRETLQMVSAWGVIPGDKKNPHPVPGGAIQVDGMAVEFNIDPVDNVLDWNHKLKQVEGELFKAIPPELQLVTQPVADFDPEYFASLPEESKVLGCEPDFDAYSREENPRPDGNPPMRTASGHIHIGWTSGKDPNDPDHAEDCIEVVKQLDFYLGLPSMLWDHDTRRRSMYGRAGVHRRKSYGVEYRTPSNMWLTEPMLRTFVFTAAKGAVEDLFEGIALRVKLPHYNPQYYLASKRPSLSLCETLALNAPGLNRAALMELAMALHGRMPKPAKIAKAEPPGLRGNIDAIAANNLIQARPRMLADMPPGGIVWGAPVVPPAPDPRAILADRRREPGGLYNGIPLRALDDDMLERARRDAMNMNDPVGRRFFGQVMEEKVHRDRERRQQQQNENLANPPVERQA